MFCRMLTRTRCWMYHLSSALTPLLMTIIWTNDLPPLHLHKHPQPHLGKTQTQACTHKHKLRYREIQTPSKTWQSHYSGRFCPIWHFWNSPIGLVGATGHLGRPSVTGSSSWSTSPDGHLSNMIDGSSSLESKLQNYKTLRDCEHLRIYPRVGFSLSNWSQCHL